MEEERRARLEQQMAAMAAGDDAAVFVLVADFSPQLVAAVRRQLRRRGVERVPAGDLDGLVLDAALELRAVARAWDPGGGALPWNWAAARIGAIVQRYVGQHSDLLDEAVAAVCVEARLAGEIGAGADADPLAVFDLLRSGEPRVALLHEGFELVGASTRDRRLLLEVAQQRALGDRSPNDTVAAMAGLHGATVRQAVCRLRRRLRALAHADERFRALADLAILA